MKKSRAIRFLCSACLLCSLGSFDISAGEIDIHADDEVTSNIPVEVGDAYLQGPLGFEPNHIMLDGAIIDATGLLSNGILKWKTGVTTQLFNNDSPLYFRENITNKTWTDIITYYCNILTLTGISEQTLKDHNYANESGMSGQFVWKTGSGGHDNPVPAVYNPIGRTLLFDLGSLNAARVHYLKTLSEDDPLVLDILETSGWRTMYETSEFLNDLSNPHEDSKLGLSLKLGADYVGTTQAIDLQGNFSLANVQFYNSTTGDVIEDESNATPLSLKPGVYEFHAILTEKGDKTLISGPVAHNSDESE